VGFQGKVRGALLTVLPSPTVYGGRLAIYLDKKLGEKHTYYLLCVDNRGGSKAVQFDAGGRSLRMVSADARQIEMLPPAGVAAALKDIGVPADILSAISPGDVFPGVVRRFLCIFPADAGIAAGTRMFWGEGTEVWELDLVDARSVPPEE